MKSRLSAEESSLSGINCASYLKHHWLLQKRFSELFRRYSCRPQGEMYEPGKVLLVHDTWEEQWWCRTNLLQASDHRVLIWFWKSNFTNSSEHKSCTRHKTLEFMYSLLHGRVFFTSWFGFHSTANRPEESNLKKQQLHVSNKWFIHTSTDWIHHSCKQPGNILYVTVTFWNLKDLEQEKKNHISSSSSSS